MGQAFPPPTGSVDADEPIQLTDGATDGDF